MVRVPFFKVMDVTVIVLQSASAARMLRMLILSSMSLEITIVP